MHAGVHARTERRIHPRHDVRVAVGILGMYPTSGITVDISRGGVKVAAEERIDPAARGETCGVRFLDAGEAIAPDYVLGVVLRVEEDNGGSAVAIQFATPLEVLEVAEAR